jgi:hypothetical protein
LNFQRLSSKFGERVANGNARGFSRKEASFRKAAEKFLRLLLLLLAALRRLGLNCLLKLVDTREVE